MNVAAQVEAARTRALAVPAPDAGVLVVTGTDRVAWLNGLVTCDLSKVKPGEGAYGLAVAQKGRIITEMEILPLGDSVACVVPRAALEGLREALERYLIMEDAETRAEADTYRIFRIHGPQAKDVLEAVRGAGGDGALLDETGLGGAVVLAPAGIEGPVRAAIESKATIGDAEGWDALRLERGVPRWGQDFDATMYPQEASLEKRAVSFEKGCYLGQEVVCMLEMRGHVKRKLVSLVFDAGEVPRPGDAVTNPAGEPIGEIKSAVLSPTLGVPVALAMVKYAFAKSGGDAKVGGRAGRLVERPA
jgi:folate-binding protein YgfZ